ncbi:MAG TPA: EamA family transporter RarD [Magnetovibrio sp.]
MTDLPNSTGSQLPHAAVSKDTSVTASLAQGVVLTLGATCFWGMFPLIFKTVAHISPLEVLAHRALWALLFAALLMAAMGRREIFQRAFYAPRILIVALLSGIAVAVNWGVFIWAVGNDQVLQSSLGYYINPLLNVVLGVVFLRERLRLWAWLAVGFAAAGVLFLVVRVDGIPWVALAIALSWSLYGFVRKLAKVGSLPGLYLETLMLSPLALGFVAWLGVQGAGTEMLAIPVFATNWADSARLIATGAVTAAPLLLFGRAARILRYSTIGVLMYIVPTAQFLLAVYVFHEPFTPAHLWAFSLIWTGLVIYAWDSLRHRKPRPKAAAASGPTVPLA